MPLEPAVQKNEAQIELQASTSDTLCYFVQYGVLDAQGNTIKTVGARIKVPASMQQTPVLINPPSGAAGIGCVNIKSVTTC